MRRAFVSHSTRDDGYVAEMESFLCAAGFDEVFNDVSAIRPDEQFWPEIEKGIANADTLVVVITVASNASEWVRREVEFARSLARNVIPVWIEDCPIPPIFDGHRLIDFRPRSREERRFDISRIVKYAPAELIGREDETKLLNDAWEKVLRIEKGRPRLLTFVALGGEGKTSLVAKWAAELAHQDWPGCDAAFAWSFYSQGTREQVAASSDLLLKEALTFFGDDADKQFAASPAGAYEKGQRLARIVGQRRSLLILDGLEPLQYAPTSPTPGQLKDQGIAALLKGLATTSHGLCVVTTRYSLPDLRAFWQTTAPEVKLLRLSRAAGVHLLQSFGVKGSLLRNLPFHQEQVNELEKLVEDVQGHALTLNLLGTYLRDAHAGDIRQRDLVKLEEADAEEQGGHAFRVMEAYEREFEREGDKGQRALAVLRLLGMFDRPVTSDCFDALLQAPAIPGLTEPLVPLTEAQQSVTFKRLEDARLLAVNRDASGALDTLDAHPLVREYFARQVRTQQPDAWRAAHRRLYEHLCATTHEGNQPTLEDLQPLYQAVAHGCQAGLRQEAYADVWWKRICRGQEFYSRRKLGAIGSDLAAIAGFFLEPWRRVATDLRTDDAAWLFNGVAFRLRALGRLAESIKPLSEGIRRRLDQEDWRAAAVSYDNLAELQTVLGELDAAIKTASQSVEYADRTSDMFRRCAGRAILADALFQRGRIEEANDMFRAGEALQAQHDPASPMLYGIGGFRLGELLLAAAEIVAWRKQLGRVVPKSPYATSCADVRQRVEKVFRWRDDSNRDSRADSILYVGLDYLIYVRALFYQFVLEPNSIAVPNGGSFDEHIGKAVQSLWSAAMQEHIPRGLLTRAWLRFFTGARTGPESAQSNLDEAWEIAERGPMRLHMADIHLHRARLFFREAQYPWESPQADLAAAEKLINDCGYHRRDEELADAKAAIFSI